MVDYTVTTYSPAEYLQRQGFVIEGPPVNIPRRGRAFVADVQALVCRHYDISPDVLTGPSRKRKYARPRQVAMYLCREHTRSTLCDIARRFSRDHSTVLSAIAQVERLRCKDEQIERDITILNRMIALRAHGTPP